MQHYSYQATDVHGKHIKGSIQSESQHDAILLLKNTGLYPFELNPLKRTASEIPKIKFWQRVSGREIMFFIIQLSTMLKAGISLVLSFDVIISQIRNDKFRNILNEIKLEIIKGRTLSESCAKYTRVFPPLFSCIIKAGEESGQLEMVLDRYAQFTERSEKMKSEIRNTFIYPAFLIVLSVIVAIFLTNVVLPNFEDILKISGAELPGISKLLLNINAFIKIHYRAVLITLFVSGITIFKLIKTETGSFYFDLIKLKIPILGKIYFKSIISRFMRTMSTLLSSGITFLKNLTLATNVINNKVIAKKIYLTFDNISKGDRIAKQFEKTKIFTPITIQMIATGESTGKLDLMFEEIAKMYDREIEASIKRLTTSLEPIVLTIVAGVISFIAVSLVSSVMKAVNSYR